MRKRHVTFIQMRLVGVTFNRIRLARMVSTRMPHQNWPTLEAYCTTHSASKIYLKIYLQSSGSQLSNGVKKKVKSMVVAFSSTCHLPNIRGLISWAHDESLSIISSQRVAPSCSRGLRNLTERFVESGEQARDKPTRSPEPVLCFAIY